MSIRPASIRRGEAENASQHAFAGALKRRRQTKRNPGEHRDREGEREHAGIDRRRQRAILRDARQQRSQSAQAPPCQPHGQTTAADRDNHTLGEHLPNQPGAGRADRRADRDFPAPRFGPRQKEVRQIGAGDQKYQPDRARQDQ
jgi:hypothetical protein